MIVYVVRCFRCNACWETSWLIIKTFCEECREYTGAVHSYRTKPAEKKEIGPEGTPPPEKVSGQGGPII